MLGQAWLSRAGIIGVRYPVAIGIGATVNPRWAWLVGAGVSPIQEPVPISIALARDWTTIALWHASFGGAGVLGI
jgi:hypothetical protein